MQKCKIGIALGGGSARGLSQIGVLEVLEEKGIFPDIFAGTSMGALIAGLYLSSNKPASWLRARLREFMKTDSFRRARFDVLAEAKPELKQGIFSSMAQALRKGVMYSYSVARESIIPRNVFEGIIEELVPDINIEDLPKPFVAVSLDVNSGEEMLWTKGSLRKAIMASSAIPGFFPPQIFENHILVDGGWTNSVPVRPARVLGADIVIAVDTSRGSEEFFEFKRGLDLIIRTAQIMMKRLRELQLEEADVLISPAVEDIHWANFLEPENLIERGRQAALPKVEEIQRVIRRFKRKGIIKGALEFTKKYQKFFPEHGG